MIANSSLLDELRQKRQFIKEEYGKLQNGNSSADEFVGKLNPLINEVIFEKKWKGVIEKEQIKSLFYLLINFNTRVTNYNYLTDMGDREGGNIQLAQLQYVRFELVDKISSITENKEEKVE